MYEHGWFKIAFERELTGAITPLRFFGRPLIAVKGEGGAPLRIFDATCPHRGANLGYGSRLAGTTAVRCNFHGMKVGLGVCSDDDLSVREYKTLVVGGMVFLRLSDREEPALEPALEELAADHVLVPGFTMETDTALEVVSENGWDPTHFKAVHGLPFPPKFTTYAGPRGELVSEGRFVIRRSGWHEQDPEKRRGELESTFYAHAFSPGLVIAHLRGAPPFNYGVITGSTSHGKAEQATVRVTLAIPRSVALGERFVESLLAVSKRGLDEDDVIWKHLDLDAPSHLLPGDELFRVFADFCWRFGVPRDRRIPH